MLCSFSTLDNANLETIQALENGIMIQGSVIDYLIIESAVIDDEALSKISELEKKLGVVLVAVQ